MLCSFFRSGHGKGPHDGVGTMVKRFLWREQLNAQGRKLQNAKEVVTFLHMCLSDRPKSSYSSSIKLLHRTFWHVKVEDVDRVPPLFICDPIKCTMKIHPICAINKQSPSITCQGFGMLLWVLFG
jgi:hypothetical protein